MGPLVGPTTPMTGGIVSPLRFDLVGRRGLPSGWTPPCPSLGTSTVGSSQTARGVPSAGRAGGFGQSVSFLSGGARNTLGGCGSGGVTALTEQITQVAQQ